MKAHSKGKELDLVASQSNALFFGELYRVRCELFQLVGKHIPFGNCSLTEKKNKKKKKREEKKEKKLLVRIKSVNGSDSVLFAGCNQSYGKL